MQIHLHGNCMLTFPLHSPLFLPARQTEDMVVREDGAAPASCCKRGSTVTSYVNVSTTCHHYFINMSSMCHQHVISGLSACCHCVTTSHQCVISVSSKLYKHVAISVPPILYTVTALTCKKPSTTDITASLP